MDENWNRQDTGLHSCHIEKIRNGYIVEVCEDFEGETDHYSIYFSQWSEVLGYVSRLAGEDNAE